MFAREVAPANYDNVIACLQQAGIHPHTRHAARQWLTVMALVSAGQGVALVPACMQTVGMNGVRFAALRGSRVNTPAVQAWRPQGMPAVLEAFVASVRCLVEAAQAEPPAAGS